MLLCSQLRENSYLVTAWCASHQQPRSMMLSMSIPACVIPLPPSSPWAQCCGAVHSWQPVLPGADMGKHHNDFRKPILRWPHWSHATPSSDAMMHLNQVSLGVQLRLKVGIGTTDTSGFCTWFLLPHTSLLIAPHTWIESWPCSKTAALLCHVEAKVGGEMYQLRLMALYFSMS